MAATSRTSCRPAVVLAVSVTLWAITGCADPSPIAEPASETAKPAYSHDSTGGPASMTVTLDRLAIGLADQIVLTQTLHTEPGFVADLPEYLPEDFEDFVVVDIRQDKPIAAEDGSTTVLRRFTLEPQRSGTLTIAPMYVYFHRNDDKAESYFTTAAIEVTVTGIDSAESLAVSPAKPIFRADPDAPTATSRNALVASVAIILLVIVAAILIVRRRRTRPIAITLPHTLAMAALQRLLDRDLIGAGQIEPFFVELSAILRAYIERRFDVRAPEQTTEEFLIDASRHEALAGYRTRLHEFLTLADQVKFATYRPPTEDADASVHVLRQFVKETTDGVV